MEIYHHQLLNACINKSNKIQIKNRSNHLLKITTYLLFLVGITPSVLISQTTVGPEFKVNSHTSDNQINPSVAMDSDGNFVCAWNSEYQDGDGYGVYARRYNANGDTLGPEIQVNVETDGWQLVAEVATAPNGSFVIAWSSSGDQDGDGYGIYTRLFDSMGNPLSGEIQVNTDTVNNQTAPAIAMDTAGNFVIVWESRFQDGDERGIYGQRFNSSGAPIGGEFLINTYTTNAQITPSVAMKLDGSFIVTWVSVEQDGDWWGVYAQRFNSSGSKEGSEFRVNQTTIYGQAQPDIAMDSAGNFAIVWMDQYQDSSSAGVFARLYDANGDSLTNEFLVNTYSFSEQSGPTISMDVTGNFIIAWQSYEQDGDHFGITARAYKANGDTLGAEFIVNSTTANAQLDPSIVLNDQGNFIVLWESFDQDGDDNGIYGQRFNINFNGNNCNPNPLTIGGIVSSDTIYMTTQYIESTQIILSGNTVKYQAGIAVDLLAGFEVQAGALFTSEIVDCN